MRKYIRAILAGSFAVILSSLFACSHAAVITPLTTTLATGPQSASLVNGNITVNAKTNNDYPFNVSATMKDVKVIGSFSTFGGAPNAIEVYIMDDATYVQWLKGRTVQIPYDSGSLSSGDINQAITAPGKYHLIFTNYAPASLSPAQQVSATVELDWDY